MGYREIDRNQEVAERVAKYHRIMRELAATRWGHTAHVETRDDGSVRQLTLEFTTSAQDVLRTVVRRVREQDFAAAMNKESGEGTAFGADFGLSMTDYAAEIMGETNKTRAGLEAAMEELRQTGLLRELEMATIGLRKRRRRVYSDSDGDFDYSRRDEDYCFSRMQTMRKAFPSIEVIYPVNFNAGAANSDISQFHARCVALADVLEKAGYRVGLTGETWSARPGVGSKTQDDLNRIAGGYVPEWNSVTRSVIRAPGEYGDMLSYAPIANVDYYRLAMFKCSYDLNHHVHAIGETEKRKKGMEGDFQALRTRPIPVKPGQVVLTFDLVASLFGMDEKKRKELFNARILNTIGASLPAA